MVAAGAHPKLLQAQLGHTSINVTLNTYGHLFPTPSPTSGRRSTASYVKSACSR